MRSKWFYKIKWIFIAFSLGSGFCIVFANDEMWTTAELYLAFFIYAMATLFALSLYLAEKENAKIYKDACRFKAEKLMLIEILEHIDEQRKRANA